MLVLKIIITETWTSLQGGWMTSLIHHLITPSSWKWVRRWENPCFLPAQCLITWCCCWAGVWIGAWMHPVYQPLQITEDLMTNTRVFSLNGSTAASHSSVLIQDSHSTYEGPAVLSQSLSFSSKNKRNVGTQQMSASFQWFIRWQK